MSAVAPPLLLAVLFAASPSYVRTHANRGAQQGPHCLWWQAGALTFHQSERGNPATPGEASFEAISRAARSWQEVMDACGNLSLVEGARVADRRVGYDVTAPDSNENLVLFRTLSCGDVVPSGDACLAEGSCGNTYDCWEHDPNIVALTTTTFDLNTGRLVDADVELNASNFVLTAVDSPPCTQLPYDQGCIAYDIQGTATHELGHFLGLDHDSETPDSLMAPTTRVGDLGKRTLDPGSRAFVCDVYPKGVSSRDCVAPAIKPSPGGCGAAGAGPGAGSFGAVLALLGLGRRAGFVSHRGDRRSNAPSRGGQRQHGA